MKRKHKKRCKYYEQRGRVTAYCNYLGNGTQCYKVCNMYVEITEQETPMLNENPKDEI